MVAPRGDTRRAVKGDVVKSLTNRIAGGVLSAALMALGASGAVAPATASDRSAYCGHSYGYGYEHRTIIYQGYGTMNGRHSHYYQHDVNNWPDHYKWQYC